MSDLEKARNDRTGFIKYSLEKEHKELLYKAVAKMMELLVASDEGATFSSMRRTFGEIRGYIGNFEKQLGFEAPASKKK